jgi:hypothetical protein
MSGFQFIPRSERGHDASPVKGSVYSEQTQHVADPPDRAVYHPVIAVCEICYVRIRRTTAEKPWEHAPEERPGA